MAKQEQNEARSTSGIKYLSEKHGKELNKTNKQALHRNLMNFIATFDDKEARDNYLESIGYDPEKVGKEGAKFIKEQLKKVQQNDYTHSAC